MQNLIILINLVLTYKKYEHEAKGLQLFSYISSKSAHTKKHSCVFVQLCTRRSIVLSSFRQKQTKG